MCGCVLHTPHWGPGLQPRHVPWLGIEPMTLWFTGWHSIHWATPSRALHLFFIQYFFILLHFPSLLKNFFEIVSRVRPWEKIDSDFFSFFHFAIGTCLYLLFWSIILVDIELYVSYIYGFLFQHFKYFIPLPSSFPGAVLFKMTE